MTEASQLISRILNARNWSQRDLAQKVGVSPTTISKIVRGHRVNSTTLTMLRRVHGLGSLQPEHFTNGASE